MARVQQQGSPIRFEGTFDEQAFRNYVRLFMRPHEWPAGWWFIVACGLMSCMYFLFVVFAMESLEWWRILCLLLGIICAYYVILGIRMVAHVRRPNWDSKSWMIRTNVAFSRMHRGYTENPLCYHVLNANKPEDSWPALFGTYSLFYLPFGNANMLSDPLYRPLTFNPPYWLSLGLKMPPKDVKLEIVISGTFMPDCILKGSHDRVFADSYADVHDVIEDQRRYPGLAIIRHQNAYSQLVVFTDKLEGGTWDDAKRRILAASPKALPRKERRRLAAEAVERA